VVTFRVDPCPSVVKTFFFGIFRGLNVVFPPRAPHPKPRACLPTCWHPRIFSNAQRPGLVLSEVKTLFATVLFCWLAAGSSRAQMPGPPENDNSTNGLTVWLDLRWNTNNAVFTAPAKLDLMGYVGLNPQPAEGDQVRVDFFADQQHLGTGHAVWHGAEGPPPRKWYLLGPPPAQPMHIIAAQFYPAEFVWRKVPAGTYALTARATWTNGITTVSAPVQATVLP
jgi:hypothetical protein